MTQDELGDKFIAARERDGKFPSRSAVAYFLCTIMPVDGETHPKEEQRLLRIIADDFDMADEEAKELIEHAKGLKTDADSMQIMADLLCADLGKQELLLLISHLWEMVFADGKLHETEVLFVERVARLLGVAQKDVVIAMNTSEPG